MLVGYAETVGRSLLGKAVVVLAENAEHAQRKNTLLTFVDSANRIITFFAGTRPVVAKRLPRSS
jgi:hypothetical protein